MKKIEMIRVRSSTSTIADVMPYLTDYINRLKAELCEEGVEIMHHSINQGDIAVFIIWENAEDQQKSMEGLLVADTLMEIGALTHVVWLDGQGIRRS